MDLDSPVFPAPPGYNVDLANPQRSGVAANLWVGAVGMCVAAVFVGTRMYTKIVLAGRFTSDDGALLAAWLFSIAIQAGILYQYSHGTLGVHIWEITGHQVNFSLNLVNITSILYCPFLALAKFSLLFVYLKLSLQRWFRLCVYASMFLVIGYNIVLMCLLLFPCMPVKRTWDISITEGSCIDRTPVFMATAVLNMATDILLLVLPIPMIMKLQMPRAQKLGVICAFGIGSATCITSGVRLVLLFPMLRELDQTWAVVMPGLWILIEANLVIITGCLPAMRRFLRHVAPQLMGESSSRSRGRSHKQSSVHDTVSTQPTQLQTIGSKTTKKSYKRMEDDHVSVSSDEMTTAGWRGEQDYEREVIAGAGWQGDQDSEHGIVVPAELGQIVKTETVVVRSDVRDSHKKDGAMWNAGL